MRDREPSLWDILFGTPKKKGKEKFKAAAEAYSILSDE